MQRGHGRSALTAPAAGFAEEQLALTTHAIEAGAGKQLGYGRALFTLMHALGRKSSPNIVSIYTDGGSRVFDRHVIYMSMARACMRSRERVYRKIAAKKIKRKAMDDLTHKRY